MEHNFPTTSYVRRPFVLEAVEVTTDNIEELAAFIGTLKTNSEGTPFILVDKKRVEKIWRVYPGFFVTFLNGRIRCYSPKIFTREFAPYTDDVVPWVDFMTKSDEEDEAV